MFNNPLDSFHNTVADAKEEREQLDRLLTVSTPRERALAALTALAIVIFAAWLFFGSLARSLTADGVLLEPGEKVSGTDQPVQALVWIQSDAARQIGAGMSASMEVVMADGQVLALDGGVVAIAAVPLSDSAALIESTAPVSLHRVEIALDERLDFASLAGRECEIVIELGRQSPVALFGLRRS